MKQKSKKRETRKWGAKISAPTLKTQPKLSQLSQTELTQSTQKKSFSKFSSIFQTLNFQFKIFNPKFSIPHSQCPNFKLKSSVFKKFKPQISRSKFQALIFKILCLKISDFKFQISIKNLKVSKS